MATRGLTVIDELRRRGWGVRVDGDRLMVQPPTPEAAADAGPLLDELRRRKAEVVAALREAPPAERPCPTCGATAELLQVTPEELDDLRRRRALAAAERRFREHQRDCRVCVPELLRFCDAGRPLHRAAQVAWGDVHLR